MAQNETLIDDDNPITTEQPMAEEELIACPSCGFMNPIGQKLCTKCQTVLVLGSATETHKLPPSPDQPGVPKWGSTHIEQKLFLHVSGNPQPIELTLEERDFVIGRLDPKAGTAPDIDLTDYDASSMGVSRQHARLSYKGKSMKISDLNSANHTYLNGYKLVPNQARILRDGDEIRLGRLSLTVQFGEKAIPS